MRTRSTLNWLQSNNTSRSNIKNVKYMFCKEFNSEQLL